MKRFDKIITKHGAGGLLKAGLIGTILIVNGSDIFIRIGGNSWHVKAHQIELTA